MSHLKCDIVEEKANHKVTTKPLSCLALISIGCLVSVESNYTKRLM